MEKAPQAFDGLALLAAWAIGANIWFVDGAEAVTSAIGWAVGLVLFVAITRSSNALLHASFTPLIDMQTTNANKASTPRVL